MFRRCSAMSFLLEPCTGYTEVRTERGLLPSCCGERQQGSAGASWKRCDCRQTGRQTDRQAQKRDHDRPMRVPEQTGVLKPHPRISPNPNWATRQSPLSAARPASLHRLSGLMSQDRTEQVVREALPITPASLLAVKASRSMGGQGSASRWVGSRRGA
jgi:hypothetical protein